MLRQPTASDIRLNKITTCLTATVELLTEVNNAFGTPFLQAVCITTSSLITVVQNVKKNKEDCIELMENIYVTLDAIATMHLNPDTAGSIPPATLHSIGKFTETLYKIHTFVEGQAEGYRLKRLLRHSEMNTLLKECRADLQDAQNIFRIETPAILSVTIDEMRDKTEAAHRDLLELISSLSDGTVSDGSSSVCVSF
ncbi:hypothetical protein B0H14DRAFT_360838 [Mycena olivaceomarginata]|nr:hypothetical protein B0H14DRAFT_360838 [Mycena olivaceomarginata]